MGEIAQRKSDYRTDAQRCGRILYLVSEDAAEAEDGVGDYVVDEADANGFPELSELGMKNAETVLKPRSI